MNFPAHAGVRNAALVLLCSLYSALAQGQNANPGASDSGNAAQGGALEPIVITATRTAQPLDRTGSSMSVINADDLATQQTAFVGDALAQTPGLSVTREGGPGQLTSVFIRGAETGESVTLIDGIRINDPSAPDGAPVLGDLLVNNIDRIEVLRGPQSTLYGSDAIGGVVNILTQRGGPQPFTARSMRSNTAGPSTITTPPGCRRPAPAMATPCRRAIAISAPRRTCASMPATRSASICAVSISSRTPTLPAIRRRTIRSQMMASSVVISSSPAMRASMAHGSTAMSRSVSQ
jgi:outer membrane receptor protein involved in Fe transport